MIITAKIQAKRIPDTNYIELSGTIENKPVSRIVTYNKVDTTGKLANWLIVQNLDDLQPDMALQKQYQIEFHLEEVVDDETGESIQIKVIDLVITENLPWLQCLNDLIAIPCLGGTATEAEQWVEDNVIDFDTSKALLKQIAGAVVLLQQQVKDLSQDRY